MSTPIEIGDLVAEVEFKRVKNINLRVCPPDGTIKVSAPRRVGLKAVRSFVRSQRDWIERQRAKLGEMQWEPPRSYVDGEIHPVWGLPHALHVVERAGPARVVASGSRLRLGVPPGTDVDTRRDAVEAWYRGQLRLVLPANQAHWERRLGVKAERISVRRMRTKWGSCSIRARTIRLNTELARKPPECFEYVLVHELVHLIEPSHNARFHTLMDRFLPDWKDHRDLLDRLPMAT